MTNPIARHVHRLPVDVAWRKSGKIVCGSIIVEIQDLSHLGLPVVAEFVPETPDRTGRVWRGDETGLWARIDRHLAGSSEEVENITQYIQPLKQQLGLLATKAVSEGALDGIAIHGMWIPDPSVHTRYDGVEAIVANGGAKALEDALWSASRYAVMDDKLWRRHPGPLMQIWNGKLDHGSRIHWDSFYGPFVTLDSIPDLLAERPGLDVSHANRIRVRRPDLASAYDVDGLNLEKLLVHVRDLIGAGRVAAMGPKAMRCYAALVSAHSDPCPSAPRKEANSGWVHDRRAFEFPFRPALFPLVKDAYENCLDDLHPTRRESIEDALGLLEPRWRRDFQQPLSQEDEDALTGLSM